ncbi:hypothetical protein F0562_000150 [Nyssa sinensis]|uniref:Uncharacterized protein n=1 Tax=Nyssa sinensis TaxID=561372 RepID=A0A5J5C0Q0_9ASTE|nr:hypothetical protein F0562_000150 [Nyssa sinensis]
MKMGSCVNHGLPDMSLEICNSVEGVRSGMPIDCWVWREKKKRGVGGVGGRDRDVGGVGCGRLWHEGGEVWGGGVICRRSRIWHGGGEKGRGKGWRWWRCREGQTGDVAVMRGVVGVGYGDRDVGREKRGRREGLAWVELVEFQWRGMAVEDDEERWRWWVGRALAVVVGNN